MQQRKSTSSPFKRRTTDNDRTVSGLVYDNELASVNGRLCEKIFLVLKNLWGDVMYIKKHKLPMTDEIRVKEQKIKFILELLHED